MVQFIESLISNKVTSVCPIENTPMVVSSDDVGTLKGKTIKIIFFIVWDIRTLKCIQTIELGSKTIISKLLNVSNCGKLCFIGSRINLIS